MEGCGERIELARRTAPGLFSFDYVLPGGDGGDHNYECEMMIVMRKQKGTSYKMNDENTGDDQKSEKCF